MEDIDTQILKEQDEDTMFLCDVCGDDHELLFLDSYIRDVFRGQVWNRGHGGSIEESTI